MSEIVSDEGSGVPKKVGEYEIISRLGKGQYAVVYRARRTGDVEDIALKKISVNSMNDVKREKCLKEVRLLEKLDHPNIIRYKDSFILENDLIVISEWAAAGDLKRQLTLTSERGISLTERIVWKYFSQICDAIQYMDQKRIMHRDLKPHNIFLTTSGTIKVGDLGFSRELSEHTVQAYSSVGTPLYMAPEVLKGDCGYDFQSEIWSLGCILYELAMLKSPFKQKGVNMLNLFMKITSGEYLPIADSYSEQLCTLAYSMINPSPAERPQITTVCEIARRMHAETSKRRTSKTSTTIIPPILTTIPSIMQPNVSIGSSVSVCSGGDGSVSRSRTASGDSSSLSERIELPVIKGATPLSKSATKSAYNGTHNSVNSGMCVSVNSNRISSRNSDSASTSGISATSIISKTQNTALPTDCFNGLRISRQNSGTSIHSSGSKSNGIRSTSRQRTQQNVNPHHQQQQQQQQYRSAVEIAMEEMDATQDWTYSPINVNNICEPSRIVGGGGTSTGGSTSSSDNNSSHIAANNVQQDGGKVVKDEEISEQHQTPHPQQHQQPQQREMQQDVQQYEMHSSGYSDDEDWEDFH